MNDWHILTSEYPPDVGGVSDYTQRVAEALASAGECVHVWCPPAAERPPASGVHVHAELGRFRPCDLRRLAARLNRFEAPRRILVQWVPHGFGYRSMNLWFCIWLAGRALKGDAVQLMVHEPFIEFTRGPLRHVVMALVHRLMTLVLMRAAVRVWVAIPAWAPLLKPYAWGRRIPIEWLPIPACVPSHAEAPVDQIRRRYAHPAQPLVGHFGSHGPEVSALLEERLVTIMDGAREPALLLIGVGSEALGTALVARHPAWTTRVHVTGYVTAGEIGGYLKACDVFVQPYPDGITSRRTSAMACLAHGRPVVTTSGRLTEPLWAESDAVVLAHVADTAGFTAAVVRLLDDSAQRGRVGWRAQRLHSEHFTVSRVVTSLRAA